MERRLSKLFLNTWYIRNCSCRYLFLIEFLAYRFITLLSSFFSVDLSFCLFHFVYFWFYLFYFSDTEDILKILWSNRLGGKCIGCFIVLHGIENWWNSLNLCALFQFLNLLFECHIQIQGRVQEMLKQHDLTRTLATRELVWFIVVFPWLII